MSIVARPAFQLRSLSIPMRWEVTRRNPYYYVWWKLARAEHRHDPLVEPEDALLRQAAIAILGLIGVSGEPPDPATPFDQLGADQLERGWLSGAVHPVTMRGLAGLLIAALPKQTLAHLGRRFLEAACDDVEGQPPKQVEALRQLSIADCEGLDSYADEAIVSINPAASERNIREAINQLLKNWKQDRELGERRDRSDKHEEYLAVWDQREGWRNGVYDRGAEKKFVEIAAETKQLMSTLNNQYCRAFELIVGVPYSRELWWQLFGPIKLPDFGGAVIARTRRPMSSPVPRPVPESVVGPPRDEDGVSFIGNAGGTSAADYVLLINDLKELFAAGRTDAEISAELELSVEAISYVRERGDLDSLVS